MTLFEKFAAEFGAVDYQGKTYALTNQATQTDRVFPGSWGDAGEGEGYTQEWSAAGIDAEENEVVVRWQFEVTKGQEPADDEHDWASPYQVIFA